MRLPTVAGHRPLGRSGHLVLAPAALLAALAITWSVLLPWRAAVLVLGSTLLCALPGVLAAKRLCAGATWLTAACLGAAWGYGLTSLTLLAAWVAGLRDPLLLVAAPLIASLVAWLGATPFRDLVRAPTLTRRDGVALCLLLLLVPAVVARPFAQVDAEIPGGRAWRAYFTADVVWAVAVVAEIEKGDVPPRNPYRFADTLHYYWLAHLVPALQHRAVGPGVRIHQVLLANAVLAGLAFVGFLFVLARSLVPTPWAAALGCLFVVCCHSFEGAEQLLTLWSWGVPLDLVRYMNIDAVTRWVYKGMPIDGLQRLLLYQPQHQLGYVVGMSALLVLQQTPDRLRTRVVFLVGAMLATSLLLSTFSALMLTVVASAWLGVEVLRRREFVRGAAGAFVAAVPLLLAVLLANGLEYVEHGDRLVSLRVNPLAQVRWPFVLFLSLGGAAIAVAIGVGLAARAHRLQRLTMPIVVMAVSIFFYFFVDVRDHQNVYVGWRAGHLILIAAVPAVALAFDLIRATAGPWRVVIGCVLLLAGAAALPTFAIDLYNAQDVTNFERAPGFRWTLRLTHDELQALQWIRRATPPDAVVQVEPFLHDPATWAWVPAFAERRMSAGLPISMIPIAKYQRASERVREVYRQTSGEQAYLLARTLGIEYLVIGPLEQGAYPQLGGVLRDSPFHWRLVFENPSVRIFARLP